MAIPRMRPGRRSTRSAGWSRHGGRRWPTVARWPEPELLRVAQAQLLEASVADAEVMGDLVHHRVADDHGLPPRRRGHALDRAAKDADPIGEVRLLIAARGERQSFIDPKESRGGLCPLGPPAHLVFAGLVLDHDLEIADLVAELRRKLRERVANQPREARAAQIGHVCTLALGGSAPHPPGCTLNRRSHPPDRTRAQSADARLGKADLTSDLSQREAAPIREHQDAA